jgi:anti-sigma B factor antagonist
LVGPERGSSIIPVDDGAVGKHALEIEHVVRGSRHTLTLTGELDLAAAADLNRKLLRLCRTGTRVIVLDLRNLTFIDAAGLHIVVVAKELCQRYGSELALIPGPKQVQRVFELTNLLGVLPFQREQPA